MHNPRYHYFSPRIAGTWSLRRCCVWKIFQHRRQRLTPHASHLMTWAREPAGLLLGTSLGLNSLCAHLCRWHTGFSPGAGTGMWFAVCGFVVQSNLQPTLGWRESLRIHSWSSIFSGGTLCSCRHLFRRLLLPLPIFVQFQVRISDRLVPVVMRPLNRNSLQLTVPLVRDV